MTELFHALLAFPTIAFTACLGLALLYWVMVIVGAADLNPFDGAEGAAKGAVEGAVKGVAESAGDVVGDHVNANALTEALAWLGNPALEGQFKTPSLRGLAATGPYGHGGSEIDLAAVAKRYGEKGLAPEDPRAVGRTEPWVPQFDVHAQHELAEFLATFTAVVRP